MAPQCPATSAEKEASQHRQVVAGLGLGLERPAAGTAGRQACQEATSALSEAGLAAGRRWLLGSAVAAAQAQLAYHAFEELGHVVLQSG